MAVYRELKWRDLPRILLETANQTAQVMFIVATAGLFGWFLIYMRVPDALIRRSPRCRRQVARCSRSST